VSQFSSVRGNPPSPPARAVGVGADAGEPEAHPASSSAVAAAIRAG
jgi:hypothetical protein